VNGGVEVRRGADQKCSAHPLSTPPDGTRPGKCTLMGTWIGHGGCWGRADAHRAWVAGFQRSRKSSPRRVEPVGNWCGQTGQNPVQPGYEIKVSGSATLQQYRVHNLPTCPKAVRQAGKANEIYHATYGSAITEEQGPSWIDPVHDPPSPCGLPASPRLRWSHGGLRRTSRPAGGLRTVPLVVAVARVRFV